MTSKSLRKIEGIGVNTAITRLLMVRLVLMDDSTGYVLIILKNWEAITDIICVDLVSKVFGCHGKSRMNMPAHRKVRYRR